MKGKILFFFKPHGLHMILNNLPLLTYAQKNKAEKMGLCGKVVQNHKQSMWFKGKIRRASPDDVPEIVAMFSDVIRRNYGIETKAQVEELIESKVLTIVALEEGTENVVGCLSVNDFPNVASVDPSAWESFMWTHYRAIELGARATMFVMLLCWIAPHSKIVCWKLMESVFLWDMYMENLVFLVPEKKPYVLHETDRRIESFLRRVGPDVKIADRRMFCPYLSIRRAVEEDNDDLVGMIETQNEYIRKMYGDFYISEFVVALDKQKMTRKILVSVRSEFLAVGGMMFNSEIFLEHFESDFQLEAFHGLKKEDGSINAYQMELFAMSEIEDERHGFDILRVSFEVFPERDYCVLILPTSTNSGYPIIEHFTAVPRRPIQEKFFDSCLYVAHRNSVTSRVVVREAEPKDLVPAANVIIHEDMAKQFETLINPFVTEGTDRAFVLLSEQQIVGVAILRPCTEETLSEYPNYKQCKMTSALEIISLVMCPIIEPHSRWIARELLRQSGAECLIWKRKGETVESKFMSLTSHFIPISPPTYTPEAAKKGEEPILEPLWVINRKLSSLPKVDMNYNLVVVGASRTGMACIRYLLFGPEAAFLQWTNITLVSPCGLKTSNEDESDLFLCREGLIRDEVLPFAYYIDVIEAKMIAINRPKQYIELSNGYKKYYDFLILTVGMQYQPPNYLEDRNNQTTAERCVHRPMDDPSYIMDPILEPIVLPENVFTMNTVCDAERAMDYVQYLISVECECRCEFLYIVIYGVTLDAYCCVNALLELGYYGDRILFIQSQPDEEKLVFNDETVEHRVNIELEKAGVIRLPYCELQPWHSGETVLPEVKLSLDGCSYIVECAALFYYANKGVDFDAYLAVNKSGVVYDSGIVSNGFCSVYDPHIYVAGPCVNYTRFIRKHNPRQAMYNSEEVGTDLAKRILLRLNPFGQVVEPEDPRATTPRYEMFRKVCCDLPGKWKYLHVWEPGVTIASERHNRHFTMQTEHEENYFAVSLDETHCVNNITCLGRCNFNCDTIPKLYGRHEKTLGSLALKYKSGQVKDFFEYFSEPWTEAIYMDSFVDLMANIQNIETLKTSFHKDLVLNMGTFGETISDLVAESTYDVMPHVVLEVSKRWKNLGMKEEAFKEVERWWSTHRQNLRNYADILKTHSVDF